MPRENRSTGVLSVVATPIGNLQDFSPRAIETLRKADLILAEDTRTFAKLANAFGIEGRVRSYHDHNEKQIASEIVEALSDGQNIALTSEAGTPAISDPGYRLISACRAAGIEVSPIPGPCAAVAALSVCGFEIHRFTFEGFVPTTPSKRKRLIEDALEREGATVFYESPHRVRKFLEILKEADAARSVFVARELTKMYEEMYVGSAEEVLSQLGKEVRGEIVIVIRGQTRK